MNQEERLLPGLTVEDRRTIVGLILEIRQMAEDGILPDGDEVNTPTAIWLSDWRDRLKDIALFGPIGAFSPEHQADDVAWRLAQHAEIVSKAGIVPEGMTPEDYVKGTRQMLKDASEEQDNERQRG